MNDLALSAIELFSGTGMLGEGLRAGLAHMGIAYRTVCHVEREAYAAAVLVARMEEGSLDAAPIWSDVTTFPARLFRGKVDCIVAGFPCQDISVAGRRAGLDGKRSGLFFELTGIADDCGAWLMFLENVAGIATATATVMDETEGELDERAAARVVGELADLGWNAEWITISASDVGASHGRARWFCVAWRMGNAGLQYEQLQQRQDGAEYSRAGVAMGNTASIGREAGSRLNGAETTMGAAEQRQFGAVDRCGAVANTSGARPQGTELGRTRAGNWGGQEAHGSASELCGLFAPGPSDPRWGAILEQNPELAPALEPTFRMQVNGLAFDMGDSRAPRLKCVGNGVVATQAGVAFVILARRSGIFR